MTTHLDEFRSVMEQRGLPYAGPIEPDGKLHRFKCEGDDAPNSWYVVHDHDKFCVAAFGCWKRQIADKWHSTNGSTLTREEAAEMRRIQHQAEQDRRTEEEKLRSAARLKAQQMLSAAADPTEHPYLTRKKVGIHGRIRVTTDNLLLLPVVDETGSLQTLQLIAPDKRFSNGRDKGFILGGRIHGCFYVINDKADGPVAVCEGYATGASIHEATGWAVYCALTATNLSAVARVLKAKFPTRTLVICADNDRFTSVQGKAHNAGVIAATAAARETGACVATPEFSDNDTQSSDFNDLAQLSGLSEVRKQLLQALPMPSIVDALDFLQEAIPLPSELVVGILHRGSKLVLGGGSKTFKTWTLFDLAVSVASGKHWLSFPTVAAKTLYINFEIQPGFFQRRLQAILDRKEVHLHKGALELWNLRGHAADYNTLVPKIIDHTSGSGYGLIIIDPIYKLYGELNENSAGEVGRLLNSLEQLTVETGAAVAFGAHYSKGNQSSKEAIDRISGSGVFARDPDTLLNFTRHQAEGCFTVEATLRNHAPLAPFVVRWSYPTFCRADELDPENLKRPLKGGRPPSASNVDILVAFKGSSPTHPLSLAALKKLTGLSTGSLSENYLPKLRAKGWIQTADRGGQFITSSGSQFLSQNSTPPQVSETPPD